MRHNNWTPKLIPSLLPKPPQVPCKSLPDLDFSEWREQPQGGGGGGGYEEPPSNNYGPPNGGGGYEEPPSNNYGPPPNEMQPPVPYDAPPSNGYENSNNIPNNNYNSNGPAPSNNAHPQDYYDGESQPNEIYSAASTNSKTTEKLPKEKKK